MGDLPYNTCVVHIKVCTDVLGPTHVSFDQFYFVNNTIDGYDKMDYFNTKDPAEGWGKAPQLHVRCTRFRALAGSCPGTRTIDLARSSVVGVV